MAYSFIYKNFRLWNYRFPSAGCCRHQPGSRRGKRPCVTLPVLIAVLQPAAAVPARLLIAAVFTYSVARWQALEAAAGFPVPLYGCLMFAG